MATLGSFREGFFLPFVGTWNHVSSFFWGNELLPKEIELLMSDDWMRCIVYHVNDNVACVVGFFENLIISVVSRLPWGSAVAV